MANTPHGTRVIELYGHDLTMFRRRPQGPHRTRRAPTKRTRGRGGDSSSNCPDRAPALRLGADPQWWLLTSGRSVLCISHDTIRAIGTARDPNLELRISGRAMMSRKSLQKNMHEVLRRLWRGAMNMWGKRRRVELLFAPRQILRTCETATLHVICCWSLVNHDF